MQSTALWKDTALRYQEGAWGGDHPSGFPTVDPAALQSDDGNRMSWWTTIPGVTVAAGCFTVGNTACTGTCNIGSIGCGG